MKLNHILLVAFFAYVLVLSGNDHKDGIENSVSQDIKIGTQVKCHTKDCIIIDWQSITKSFRETLNKDIDKFRYDNAIDTNTKNGKLSLKIHLLTNPKVARPSCFAIDNNLSIYVLSFSPNFLFKFGKDGRLLKKLHLEEKHIDFVHYYNSGLFIHSNNDELLSLDTNSLSRNKTIKLKSNSYQNLSGYNRYFYFFKNIHVKEVDNKTSTSMVFDLHSEKYLYGSNKTMPHKSKLCHCPNEVCCSDFYKSLFLINNRSFRYVCESGMYTVVNYIPKLRTGNLDIYILDKMKKVMSRFLLKEVDGVIDHNTCLFKNENTMVIQNVVSKDGVINKVMYYLVEIENIF